jgi:hypothetical protein
VPCKRSARVLVLRLVAGECPITKHATRRRWRECGNATTAYSYHKLRYFNRQIVHLRPDAVVVFDRVISENPAFKKTFLLHTLNEPAVRGSPAKAIYDIAVCAGFKLPGRGLATFAERPGAIGIDDD